MKARRTDTCLSLMRSWSSHKIFPASHRRKHFRPKYFGLHTIVMPKRGFAWGRTKIRLLCTPIPTAATSCKYLLFADNKAWYRNLDSNNLDSFEHRYKQSHWWPSSPRNPEVVHINRNSSGKEHESCDGVAGRTGYSLDIWTGKSLEIGDRNYLFIWQSQCCQC